VPATLQATIAARIDRLDPRAKRTLSAAAVVGSRFSLDLLETLAIDSRLEELEAAELVDQVRFTRAPEYVFHHPLIRTVAYESQLKSVRAELHRRVASAVESRDLAAADENAALIAEHLEAAGDQHAAYDWHMRAGAWLSTRDVVAAWASWERARQVADALPADDADRTAMRIAACTLLCRHAFRVHVDISSTRFPELQEHRFRFAAGDGAGHARHCPVGARRCGVARRLRPGGGNGPGGRPDVPCLRHLINLRFRDTGWCVAGRRRCAARHRGGA